MRFPTDKAKIRFGNQINTLIEGMNVIESNCYIFPFHTRHKRGNNIFIASYVVSIDTVCFARFNYYAITSRRAPFSTQLRDNENIGGKGTFIACYSVKLRYAAHLVDLASSKLFFYINNGAFIAFTVIIMYYHVSI